jgi:hypothetical protein
MSMTIAPSQAFAAPSGVVRSAAPVKAGEEGASGELSPEALAVIAKLQARDTVVRQHEQAHLAAAGGLAMSGASYTYQRGPDGVSYAIGGEVQIDTSPGSTPEETMVRARAIAAAALAPADPSGADRAIAAQAQQMMQQALAQQAQQAAGGEETTGAAPDPLTELVRRAYGVAETQPSRFHISA